MVRRFRLIALAVSLGALTGPATADSPTVVDVKASRTGDTWRFDVTIRHADTGWDHYANAFVVTDADGTELGTRVLHHPHVNEQPFTRSLTGVTVPPGTPSVTVHAVDSVHGPGPGLELPLD